jgi:hypothetical protein
MIFFSFRWRVMGLSFGGFNISTNEPRPGGHRHRFLCNADFPGLGRTWVQQREGKKKNEIAELLAKPRPERPSTPQYTPRVPATAPLPASRVKRE